MIARPAFKTRQRNDRNFEFARTANDRGGASSRSPAPRHLQRHETKPQTQNTPETLVLRTSNTT
ncbi:hypothetical protein CEE69_10745 [Rhodopirellula bahusiensis]|uniref:Uncharacterized protein n=1 Tax=Rhodopirellula bahusiensis TaxID=2014065 RepID=A0A2G1WA68_9BACT|nr:hypothetical protein CEE69_10745 [Rhodopirellula bahusiensis]